MPFDALEVYIGYNQAHGRSEPVDSSDSQHQRFTAVAHACAFHNYPKVVNYLLDHDRRSLFIANHEGYTPLHCASRAVKHDIISIILGVLRCSCNLNGELPIELLLSRG